MHTALYPNLVQTKYHTPAIVHGGPFANIAHGCNSIIATDLSLKLADYVVTEGGFGSDLGMEKFMDIVSPLANLHPDLVVMVCSVRALKLHGGVKFENLKEENVEAVKIGLANLRHHLKNAEAYQVPTIVGINRFKDDTDNEITAVEEFLDALGIPYAVNTSYADGPRGATALARKALEVLDTTASHYKPLVTKRDSIQEKIEKISKTIYGADNVEYAPGVLDEIKSYEKDGYGKFNVCISKTPNSLTDDPHILNVPEHHTIHVRSLRLFTGAQFIVPLTGDVFTMPGLPKVPASKLMNRK